MYDITITEKAKGFLRKIKKEEAEYILNEVYALRENPFEKKIKKLKRYKLWRMKIKQYRAVLDILITQKQVIVLQIGYRKNVYRLFFDKK